MDHKKQSEVIQFFCFVFLFNLPDILPNFREYNQNELLTIITPLMTFKLTSVQTCIVTSLSSDKEIGLIFVNTLKGIPAASVLGCQKMTFMKRLPPT